MSDPLCLINDDLAIRPITEKFAAHPYHWKPLSSEHCKYLIGCLTTWNSNLILEYCKGDVEVGILFWSADNHKHLKRTKKYKNKEGNTCREFSLLDLPDGHKFFALVTDDTKKFLSFAISFE